MIDVKKDAPRRLHPSRSLSQIGQLWQTLWLSRPAVHPELEAAEKPKEVRAPSASKIVIQPIIHNDDPEPVETPKPELRRVHPSGAETPEPEQPAEWGESQKTPSCRQMPPTNQRKKMTRRNRAPRQTGCAGGEPEILPALSPRPSSVSRCTVVLAPFWPSFCCWRGRISPWMLAYQPAVNLPHTNF